MSKHPTDELNRGAAPLNRRSLLAAAGAGAVASIASPLPAEAAEINAYETQTGGRIYNLPRDHAMHGGDWYRGAEYQETHYFTGFFKDKKTGKPFSMFFCWSVYGYDKKLDRPLWVALYSMTDIERKKFVQCVHVMPGQVTAKGSGPDVDNKDFFADFTMEKAADGSSGMLSYKSAGETWRWMADVPKPSDRVPNSPFMMDLTGHVVKPGYQCPVPYGFTQEGLGTDLTNNLANPFTGASLSWYIIAPCMEATAKVKCDDMDLELEGQLYYEHQWGRLRIPGMEQARYFWGWARMDDGRILNWRTYRDAKTGEYVPSIRPTASTW